MAVRQEFGAGLYVCGIHIKLMPKPDAHCEMYGRCHIIEMGHGPITETAPDQILP